MKNKLRNENGSITVLVTITILTFLVILMGVYFYNTTLKNAQLQSNLKIQKIYGKDVEAIDEVYTDILKSQLQENGFVNAPAKIDGLTPIKFIDPTVSQKGSYIPTSWEDTNWYSYENAKWANAVSQDGSMWVWIPRYAYQITYTNNTDKSKGGSIQVAFLNGTTDMYYDTDGKSQTAKRTKTTNEIIDTTTGYTVHPAFTNETSIGFQNGGWKSELSGIWVAKFEAGYASGNNSAPVVASSVKYSQSTSYIKSVEAGTSSDSTVTARNWLDGIYGNTTTSIKYPTFQGTTYSMNYINHNDAYHIARHLTDGNNIYGFKNTNTDSHLMKNSEWGAVAYLSQSNYGLNGKELAVNNVSLNSGNRARTEITGRTGVDSVYAVTGCTTGSTTEGEKQTTIDKIKGTTGNIANADGVYTWDQLKGTTASSTGNITGIYDLSGGNWERTAAYVNNGNSNLSTYGNSLLQGKSTEYTTIYPHDSATDNTGILNTNVDTASINNYKLNTKIYGDAIREVSITGSNTSSWNSDYSYFVGLNSPFFMRGGNLWDTSGAGSFYFARIYGSSYYSGGFRPVLVII